LAGDSARRHRPGHPHRLNALTKIGLTKPPFTVEIAFPIASSGRDAIKCAGCYCCRRPIVANTCKRQQWEGYAMAVRIEKDGPVWTVIHDRPEARNAMDPESADALTEAFLQFDADESGSVAVLPAEHSARGGI
jgi:hypothetical protein